MAQNIVQVHEQNCEVAPLLITALKKKKIPRVLWRKNTPSPDSMSLLKSDLYFKQKYIDPCIPFLPEILRPYAWQQDAGSGMLHFK